MSTVREVMSWEQLGSGSRELAEAIYADDWVPDLILGISRGGLLVAGALAYALGVKNTATISVEFYTGIDERLELPMLLPPVPDLVDLSAARVLIADDVADTGRDARARARLLRRPGGGDAHRGALREVPDDDQLRVRVAPHRRLDHVPLERTAGRDRRRRRVASASAQRPQPGRVDPEPLPGEPVHRAVGTHPREGAVDLGDGDGAALRHRDDVAVAALDLRRDRPEDAAAAGDELPDGLGVDEGRIAGPGLDELEQPRRPTRARIGLTRGRTEPAIARAPSLARTAQVILRRRSRERREPRQSAPQHDRLIGAEVGIAEIGAERRGADRPDRGDRRDPTAAPSRRGAARRA